MLITFHYCVIFIFQILRNRKRLKSTQNLSLNTGENELELENDIRFDPPVYRQRYSKVYEILLEEKWRNKFKKLVDFGCAEFGLFVFIKNLNIEQICFVDIDENLLMEKIGKIEPLLVDQLRRRNCPLEVSVFAGSVTDPDYRLRKTDVVTALEIIEHLYPDTLDAFPFNVFSYIKPKIALLTTPNADFNVMFRSEGFRHPDHKFEWTRQQFEDWATNITERFPDYTVDISGIGKGPEDTKDLGCCSQLAIFVRKDLLHSNYISHIYAKSCLCKKDSLCKGQTIESKLLCKCVCPFCLPDFSVGVCTYSSSKSVNTGNTKKSYSDTNLDYKFQLSYNTFSQERFSKLTRDINPLYNIYYKLIQKIDYPYEVDIRSEEERLLSTFKYRIQTFSHLNSRFYVNDKERCEIPVGDIMYGDIDVSIEEVSHLLINAGYQLETCTIQETGSREDCIISLPQEMEDISSSSEVTDGYSSKSSEPNDSTKFEANIESLSDWDEVTFAPRVMQQGATSSTLEPSSEPKKPNSDPLFDSGYLKSPSPLENNPRLPQLTLQENPELAETDQFEDVVSTPSLSSEDNKLHLKKTALKEKFLGPLIPESQKHKYDPNRVNELDRFHNMSSTKTFMSNLLKPQHEFKKVPLKDLPVAGPSNGWKKSRKYKDKKTIEKKEFAEPSPLDDAKSITNCIIQNSLNKIDVGDDDGQNDELIRNLSPQPEIIPEVDIPDGEPHEEDRIHPLEEPQGVLGPPQMVENGDLANNNRDNEGNNFVANNIQEQDIDEGIDLLNDNLEELVPLLEDNLNIVDNNNDLVVHGNNLQVALPAMIHEIEEVEENADENDLESEIGLEAEDVAHASREALFDVNSEQDLLEDFDIPPQANQNDLFDMMNLGNNAVLVGVHAISSSGTRQDQPPVAASMQTNSNSFPNWLLQILGTHVVSETTAAIPLGSHDEPHFYCQGDGLGVHPSVIAVEVDEAEDADNDTSTEDSSSNNTADFAEVEPGPSDMFDMSSLPEESSLATSIVEDNIGQAVRPVGSVVWSELESNDNIAQIQRPHDANKLDEISDHVADGTRLVNEVIKAAEQEIAFRSQNGSVIPANSEEVITAPQSCCLAPISDSHDTVNSEEREGDIATCENTAAGQNDNLGVENNGFIQDVQSSDGSEVSEYSESRNDEP